MKLTFALLAVLGLLLGAGFYYRSLEPPPTQDAVFVGENATNAQLAAAARNGDYEAVKRALEQGAWVNYYDSVALRWAAHQGHADIVRLLIENEADIHALKDQALRNASENGHTAIVGMLLSAGADPDAFSKDAVNKAKTAEIRALLVARKTATARGI